MTNVYYGNISTAGTAFTLAPEKGDRPPSSPKGLIATQAVQTRLGWLGQVFVDKRIVFESDTAHDTSESAIDEANRLVVDTVAKLFTGGDA